MAEQYRTENEADKLADVQHDRDCDRRGLCREEVDAGYARELRAGVDQEEEDAARQRFCASAGLEDEAVERACGRRVRYVRSVGAEV